MLNFPLNIFGGDFCRDFSASLCRNCAKGVENSGRPIIILIIICENRIDPSIAVGSGSTRFVDVSFMGNGN